MSQIDDIEGRLLSKSATTGWADWMHGELWLFPDGLLRVPRGWIKTLWLSGYIFSPKRCVPRSFSPSERLALILSPKNVWIPFADVLQATVRHSIGADELLVTLANGQRRQLLWLPNRMVFQTLTQVFAELMIQGRAAR